MQLIFQYPPWFIIFCLILGFAYAALLYIKNNPFTLESKYTSYIIGGLAVARFITITLIAFLLLSPFIKKKNIDKIKPKIVLLHDNSTSLTLHWGSSDSSDYIASINNNLNELTKHFEIDYYTFDDDVKQGDTLDFKGQSSNLSQALKHINGTYYNQNVGAVIFASDGMFNRGKNPLYESFDFPLYTIALGDTNIQTDAKIVNVDNNKLAYLDDKIEVNVDLQAQNLEGQSYQLQLFKNNGKNQTSIDKKSLGIKNRFDEQELKFVVNANAVGIHKYSLVINPLENEVTTLNNTFDFYIEVIDNRQKILLLANAPHPDIASIKNTVQLNKNYELDVQYIKQFNASLNKYNLVILHQLPSKTHKIPSIINSLEKNKTPHWFIVGNQSDINSLNRYQNNTKITVKSARNNEATAMYSTQFKSFDLSDRTQQNIQEFPPLQVPFGDYKIASNTTICLKQQIGNVLSDFPILSFQDNLGYRSALFIGDGLWRWRMQDYYENKHTEAFNEIIEKTVNYLALKGDKRKFRTQTNKTRFFEGEEIVFSAELYNDNYEIINEPEVKLKVENEREELFPFTMNKTNKSYSYSTSSLPLGSYTYTATTSYNEKKYTASGAFSIDELQLESIQTQANHTLLRKLANKTNGKFYTIENMESIANDILTNDNIRPILYESFKTQSIINLYGLFFAILFLLTLEWFLRKLLGSY